jgi:hypothetical protein
MVEEPFRLLVVDSAMALFRTGGSFFPFLFRVFGVFFPSSVFPFVDAAPIDAPRSQRVHALIDHASISHSQNNKLTFTALSPNQNKPKHPKQNNNKTTTKKQKNATKTDFVGRGELAERQQKLGQFLAALKRLSETYGVAVVITNQVMSTPEGGMTCEFLFVLFSSRLLSP